MRTFTLTPPTYSPHSTNIVIGEDASSKLASIIESGSYDSVSILYDIGIEALAKKIEQTIGSCVMLPVQSTDASKSLAEIERLTTLMLDAGCGRRTLLVCIGGGMVTDLGGFLASVFMRGIPCILVPTSMLAMVDAAIGGKTGVNVGGRKNMLGTITHPVSVVIDLAFLRNLPQAQFHEGLVEVVKIAAMVDRPFFEWLEEHIDAVLKRTPLELSECVTRAIEAKVRIVEQDEHDRDARLLLNFGHTIGHAVEALSRYRLSHGAAVSIGMIAEMNALGVAGRERVSALLEELKMPCMLPDLMTEEALWTLMQSDKKNQNGVVRCAVPVSIGEGAVKPLSFEQFHTLFS